jgi:5-(carboxyamino)imidazole ribonucleotide synthase
MKIGILGGGQLALMLCNAAQRVGIETVVVSETYDVPAKKSADKFVHFDSHSLSTFDRALRKCEIVTLETEAIEPELIQHLNKCNKTNFELGVFKMLSNKYNQKQLVKRLGIPTLDFDGEIKPEKYIKYKSLKTSVLKQKTSGFDGRGVVFPDQIKTFEPQHFENYYIEEYLPKSNNKNNNIETIEYELAVVGAKSSNGKISLYSPTKTFQENGICIKTLTSSDVNDKTRNNFQEAVKHTHKIMDNVGYIGTFAIEYFVTNRNRVLFNELAPRVHNSGHWTIEGALTDQFENHLRAICNYPLGNTDSIAESALMMNIIGGNTEREYLELMNITSARTHLYGKSHREDRKLGHITSVGSAEATLKAEKQISKVLGNLTKK